VQIASELLQIGKSMIEDKRVQRLHSQGCRIARCG
jgi:hypothetical protein